MQAIDLFTLDNSFSRELSKVWMICLLRSSIVISFIILIFEKNNTLITIPSDIYYIDKIPISLNI